MIGELIREALYTLRTNLLRTILTMIGIILGVGAVVSIMTLGQSAYMTAEQSIQDSGYGSIQISHNYGGSSEQVMPLNQSFLTILRGANIEGVTSYEPKASGFGGTALNSNDDSIMVGGRYSTVADIEDLKYVAGGGFGEEEIEAKSQVAIIDETMANKLFGSASEAIGQSYRTDQGFYYKVVGVVKTMDGFTFGVDEIGYAYYPLSVVELEPWFQNYGYDFISVNVAMGSDYDEISQAIEDYLMEVYGYQEREEMSFVVENVKDMMAEVSMFMTAFSLGLSLIAAISLIVGGVGIMNIMLVSVTERTKEIGLMKALGAKDGDIVFQFLVESVVMTVFGGLLGVLLGVGVSWGIIQLANTFGQDMLPEFTFVIDYRSVVVSMVVSLVIGLLFGAYPAKKAAKLDPVVALRRD